jgi:hypothetical protein
MKPRDWLGFRAEWKNMGRTERWLIIACLVVTVILVAGLVLRLVFSGQCYRECLSKNLFTDRFCRTVCN